MVASTGVAELLLVLKIAFLVLLYLFVVRVIRSAGSDRQAPSQDSMILTPAAAAAAGLGRGKRGRGKPARRSVRLVVRRSPAAGAGITTRCSPGFARASASRPLKARCSVTFDISNRPWGEGTTSTVEITPWYWPDSRRRS